MLLLDVMMVMVQMVASPFFQKTEQDNDNEPCASGLDTIRGTVDLAVAQQPTTQGPTTTHTRSH
jgi:hypothetical protein